MALRTTAERHRLDSGDVLLQDRATRAGKACKERMETEKEERKKSRESTLSPQLNYK